MRSLKDYYTFANKQRSSSVDIKQPAGPNNNNTTNNSSSNNSSSSNNNSNNDDDYETYMVTKNETLVGIALKFGMTAEEVRKLNKIFHSSMLMSGQMLKVRRKSTPTTIPIAAKHKSISTPSSPTTDFSHLHTRLLGQSLPNITKSIPVSRLIREMMIPQTAVDVISVVAEYVLDAGTIPVHGILTVTPTRIIYEPDLDDPQVMRHGVVPYTFSIDTNKLSECYEIGAKTTWELILEVAWKGRTSQGCAFFVLPKQKCHAIYRKLLDLIPELKENAIMKRDLERMDRQDEKKVKVDNNNKKTQQQQQKQQQQQQQQQQTNKAAQHKEQKKEEDKKVIPVVSETIEEEEDDDTVIPVMREKSLLFGPVEFDKLRRKLPGFNKYSDWIMLYSTQKHGVSFASFQHNTKGKFPTLIFIEDTNGHVFGGFATEDWAVRAGYFGTGQSFVFSLKPDFKIYEWSRANNFFMCMDKAYFAMGGGNSGGHGFWLDSNFEYGGSSTCDTFINRCLASSEEFDCTVVEVWGFAA